MSEYGKSKKTRLRMNIKINLKVILAGVLAIFMAVACNRGDTQGFEIYGKVTGADMEGSLIYLAGLEGNTLVYADSTVIADSAFLFTGIQDKPQLKFLIPLRSVTPAYAPKPFILENGHINAIISDSGMTVSGTPLNDGLNEYRRKKTGFNTEKRELDNMYKDSLRRMTREKEAMFLARYRAIEKSEADYVAGVISRNNDNVFGGYVLLENRYILSNAQKQAILSDAKEEFFLLDGIASVDEALRRRNELNAGRKFPDVGLLDIRDGAMHRLSEYTGNGTYIVLNIWASWSAPSVAAMHNVKALAGKYSRKGVNVLSISIDTVADEWRRAVRRNGMYWINLADLQGWESGVATRYQINAIPAYMLLNADGTIIMPEGSLEEIDSRLEQLLGN